MKWKKNSTRGGNGGNSGDEDDDGGGETQSERSITLYNSKPVNISSLLFFDTIRSQKKNERLENIPTKNFPLVFLFTFFFFRCYYFVIKWVAWVWDWKRERGETKILYTFHLSNWIIHMSIYTLGAMCVCVCCLSFFISLVACRVSIHICSFVTTKNYSLACSLASKTHSHTNLSCSPFPFGVVLLLFFFFNSTSILYSILASLSLSLFFRLICVFVRKVHKVELKKCSLQKTQLLCFVYQSKWKKFR